MAQTTDDSEELLMKEPDQDTDGGTEKDQREKREETPQEEPVKDPAEEPAEEPLKDPAEEPAEEPVEEPAEEPQEDTAKEPAAEPEEEPAKEPEEEPKGETDKEPEEEPQEDASEEIEEKPAKKPGAKSKKKKGKSGSKPKKKKAAKKSRFIPDDDDEDFDEEEDLDDYLDDEDDDYDYDPEDDESGEGGMGLNLFTLFVLLIAASIMAVYFTCTVKTVHVKGNTLYTSEQIAEYVISDDTQLRHNTVFLSLLYMTPLAPKIPFEESVKVSMDSSDAITITVKDMDIAGFIPYAGKNLYFSADGIVLENSPLLVKNATFVTGLSVTGAEIGTKMTADDEVGLGMILETLEILRKYQIDADCVVLTRSGSVVMYLDEIKVQLGRSDFELKISKIAQIMPYLEGRSGTINMTNYTSADQNIILK